ncbi:MAG: putative nucleotidyltransferase [Gammaproteobacteria bacterium]|jgi:predicted nucleotidyltransferase
MSQLGDALFTTTQQKVLGLLYSQPERSFYLKEILRLTGMGVATIKRELDRMLAAGILRMTVLGNQHHYQADADCPIYEALLEIVKLTFGVSDVISKALTPLHFKIKWAFIYGSLASGKETSGSDIDLIIIGDVGFSEVVTALYSTQLTLARDINPRIYNKEEWTHMLNSSDAFIKNVLANPVINVIGDGHGFR